MSPAAPRLWACALGGLVLGACVHARPAEFSGATAAGAEQGELEVRSFVAELAAGQFAAAAARGNDRFRGTMGAPALERFWKELLEKAGASRSIDKVERQGKVRRAWVRFEFATVIFRFTLDGANAVAAMAIEPERPPAETVGLFLLAYDDEDDAAIAGMLTRRARAEAGGPGKGNPRDTFRALRSKLGAYVGFEVDLAQHVGRQYEVRGTARFETASASVSAWVDEVGRVAILELAPRDPVAWVAPAYTDPMAVLETTVFLSDRPKVRGTLVLPKGEGPFPVVVFVHDAGPQDHDETGVGSRPFRDLAFGLAQRGIASIRYDKRQRPAQGGWRSVKEHVLDDAEAALVFAEHTPRLDPSRVFVLGHGFGGYLAPRLVAARPTVSGLVLLAAPASSLDQWAVDQAEGFVAQTERSAAAQVQRDRAQKAQRLIRDPQLKPTDPLPGGVAGSYHLDLRGYRPVEVVRALPQPVLVLQGGRDLQVQAERELPAWQALAQEQPRVVVRLFPALNHRFVAGTGKPTLKEYEVAGNVDGEVLEEIARFVSAPRPQ